ncbi:MAG: hypothetical protein AB1894_25600 [Chloroflexota bacterium]
MIEKLKAIFYLGLLIAFLGLLLRHDLSAQESNQNSDLIVISSNGERINVTQLARLRASSSEENARRYSTKMSPGFIPDGVIVDCEPADMLADPASAKPVTALQNSFTVERSDSLLGTGAGTPDILGKILKVFTRDDQVVSLYVEGDSEVDTIFRKACVKITGQTLIYLVHLGINSYAERALPW